MAEQKKIRNAEGGLTLIEVIIAIMLFASAMITILGLQSSNLARTREDRQRIRAMLAAREILSALEIQEEMLPPGNKEGTIEEILAPLITMPEKSKKAVKDIHAGLLATLDIENIPLPEMGPTAMQKATVTVSWGDGPFDLFKTSFFRSGEISSGTN